ncbi:MAG: AMP-binding protein [Runella sp.]
MPAPSEAYWEQAYRFCKEWTEGKSQFLLHTSGSTGTPKPITISRQQMLASIRATQKALHLANGQTALVCLNVAYIAGTMMLARGMQIGLTMYVVPPSADPLQNLPDDISIDFMAVVPLQLQNMIDKGYHRRLDMMQSIIVGGAAVSDSLMEALQALKVPIYSTYGMTETASHIALRQLNGPTKSDFYEVLEGIQVATDSKGCLRICGDVTANQWVQTNDLLRFIDERHFEVLGRTDNIINSGGVKIQLEKVERALTPLLPSSQRFFAFGLSDEVLGQKLILVLEGKQPFDFEEIKQSLGNSLTRYEIPKEVFFIEKFTETPTGKIDKYATVSRLLS